MQTLVLTSWLKAAFCSSSSRLESAIFVSARNLTSIISFLHSASWWERERQRERERDNERERERDLNVHEREREGERMRREKRMRRGKGEINKMNLQTFQMKCMYINTDKHNPRNNCPSGIITFIELNLTLIPASLSASATPMSASLWTAAVWVFPRELR